MAKKINYYHRIYCDKCTRKFTRRGMARHMASAHTPQPRPFVPQPKKTTEYETGETHEHNLLNGKGLKLGDVVWHVRKCVITRITETEGSKDVSVTLRTTKRNWQQNEPQ